MLSQRILNAWLSWLYFILTLLQTERWYFKKKGMHAIDVIAAMLEERKSERISVKAIVSGICFPSTEAAESLSCNSQGIDCKPRIFTLR